MTATSIALLRNKNIEGKPYTRLREIEAKLLVINALPRDEISARCAIQDRKDPNYLPSECLVYLVREHRTRSMDACSEVLYKTLLERVLAGLPSGESADGARVRAFDSNVRDEGRYRFFEMVMRDRSEYLEALDIYEVRFAMALAALRVEIQRKIYRKEKHLEPIEIDQETGKIAEEVERAAGSFDPFGNENTDDYFYLLRLDKAIDALPAMQKAIVEMIRKGIPIESNQPGKIDIAKTLGKTEKTVRTHRDQAYATLRGALTKGEK